MLSKTGPVKPYESELPGVYIVECKQCPDGVYFGETGVTVANRMAGHKSYIREAKDSGADPGFPARGGQRDKIGKLMSHQSRAMICHKLEVFSLISFISNGYI